MLLCLSQFVMGQLLAKSRNNNTNNKSVRNNDQLQTPSQGKSSPEHRSPSMGSYPLNNINSVASRESVSQSRVIFPMYIL